MNDDYMSRFLRQLEDCDPAARGTVRIGPTRPNVMRLVEELKGRAVWLEALTGGFTPGVPAIVTTILLINRAIDDLGIRRPIRRQATQYGEQIAQYAIQSQMRGASEGLDSVQQAKMQLNFQQALPNYFKLASQYFHHTFRQPPVFCLTLTDHILFLKEQLNFIKEIQTYLRPDLLLFVVEDSPFDGLWGDTIRRNEDKIFLMPTGEFNHLYNETRKQTEIEAAKERYVVRLQIPDGTFEVVGSFDSFWDSVRFIERTTHNVQEFEQQFDFGLLQGVDLEEEPIWESQSYITLLENGFLHVYDNKHKKDISEFVKSKLWEKRGEEPE